jgi:molybdenum-dependent DNA-binding transcriptional regulator ModE
MSPSSNVELDRLQVRQKITEHRMTQAAAARILGLSYRQVKRLMARFRRRGAAGLVSGKRGKHGNHRLPTIYTHHILDLVAHCTSSASRSSAPTRRRPKAVSNGRTERSKIAWSRKCALRVISSIPDANAWIDGFVETYNARFSKPPGLPINLHRPLMDFEDLDDTSPGKSNGRRPRR